MLLLTYDPNGIAALPVSGLIFTPRTPLNLPEAGFESRSVTEIFGAADFLPPRFYGVVDLSLFDVDCSAPF